MTAQRYVHDILQPHVLPFIQRLPGAIFNKTMLGLTRYTRAFGNGPLNFEPWSSDVDDTSVGTPSPNYPTIPMGGRFSSRQI
ncbi:hypothetical protein TNCV_4222881 [Trichonephila clavipes]|nr:hypothetical protein TNCV_4222881 [Trichonephila clavipes]